MILSLKVSIAPEWDDIHRNFAPLIRLSNIATPLPKLVSTPNDTDEVSPHSRTCHSPAPAAESSSVFELFAPVKVELPSSLTKEELEDLHVLPTKLAAQQEEEKQYIGLVFREYCKRKGIIQKYEKEWSALSEELAELRRRDLLPHLRQEIAALVEEEATARGEILNAYKQSLRWIEEVQLKWLEEVDRQIEENRKKEEAKKATLEASKALLEQELADGRKLGSMSPIPSNAACRNADSLYMPNVALEDAIQGGPSPSALRRKAIELLEQQEAVMRHLQKQQLLDLRAKEESLRKQLEEKEKERLAVEEQRRKEKWEQQRKSLLDQERALQERLRAHEEERRQKEEERRALLEHCTAEEEIIRRRLQDQEAQRKAMEEKKERLEAQRKKELYEHIRAEEELLRQRVQQHEAEKEVEKQRQAAEAAEERRKINEALKREQEALEEEMRLREQRNSMLKQQEEALRRVKEEHDKAERAKQVALLKEQEEAVRARMRAKEITEIQANEQKLRNQQPQQTIHPSPLFFMPRPQMTLNPNEVAATSYTPVAHTLATPELLRYGGRGPDVPPNIHYDAYRMPMVPPNGAVMHPMQAYPSYYPNHAPNGGQPMLSSNPALVYSKVNSWGGAAMPYTQPLPPSAAPVSQYGYPASPSVQYFTPQGQEASWQ